MFKLLSFYWDAGEETSSPFVDCLINNNLLQLCDFVSDLSRII